MICWEPDRQCLIPSTAHSPAPSRLSYNADDKLTTLTYTDASDSLSINFSYNQADQMTQETMYSSGTLIATVSETYERAGNVKNITDEKQLQRP